MDQRFSQKIQGSSGQVKEICHLLYADDTIIFCEPREDQIRFLKTILLFFEASSGLKVNWGKSNLFPIKEVTNILNLADILGCKVENMPTVYLVCLWEMNTRAYKFGMALWRKQKGD